jgi:Putative prokaryotic signal transducing protein
MTGRRLVTVAIYDLPPLAHIARDALEAAGIKATVADDQMVGMDWLLSTAVGGVKVQVWEEDAERALAVLEEADREHPVDEADPRAPTPDGDEWGEDYEPTEADFAVDPEPKPVTEPSAPDNRDRLARRAFFTAWIGLALCPVSFYSLYLCLTATFGPGSISRRGRFELAVAWAFIPLGPLWPTFYWYY